MRLHARSWHRYAEPPPEATALIMYTSGTTGPPKGVVLSRRAIAADIDALAEAWQWTPDDTLVHGLPLFHVHGLVLGLLGSLRIGNRFVHTGKPTPQAYAAAGWLAVLRGADGVVAGGRRPRRGAGAASARLLVSGSAPLPVPVFERLAETDRARTGGAVRQHRIADHAQHPRSTANAGPAGSGCRWPACETRLVDDDGATVPHDGETIGRLQVRRPTMFDGYLNRPDATAEAFDADGWYRTGDVAVIDGDGMHRIVGRESVDLIKIGRLPGRRRRDRDRAARASRRARRRPSSACPTTISASASSRSSSATPSPEALIDYVAQQLSVHKRPREVRMVDSLPRNAMGKVLKKELAGWH